MTEYLRMSGMYWGLTALELMNSLEKVDKDDVIQNVVDCQTSCGGFSPAKGHDPHMLYTLSAIQVLKAWKMCMLIGVLVPTYQYNVCSELWFFIDPQLIR